MKLFQYVIGICALCGVSNAAFGAVVELTPTELKPRKEPMTVVSTKYTSTSASGTYANAKSNNNNRQGLQTLRVSALRYDEINGVPVAFAVSQAYGIHKVRRGFPALKQTAKGRDDLRLGFGVWPISDHETKRYLMLGAVVALKTGKYTSSRLANVGENRNKVSLVGGYSTAIGEGLSLDSFVLYNFFGDNSDYLGTNVRAQDDAASFTSYLTKRVAPHTDIYAGLEYIHGSDIFLNGVKASNGQRDVRGYVGGSMPISQHQSLALRLGKTLRVRTGLKVDNQLMLSLSHRF